MPVYDTQKPRLGARKSAAPLRPAGSPVAENGGTPSPTPPGVNQPPAPDASPGGAIAPVSAAAPPSTPPPQPAPDAPPKISHVPPTQQPPAPGLQPIAPTSFQTPVLKQDAGAVPMSSQSIRPITTMDGGLAKQPDRRYDDIPMDTINPANDLRSKQIGPGRDDAYGGDLSQLFELLKKNATGPGVDVADSDRLRGAAGATDDSLKTLANLDRFKLAEDRFKTYSDETAPEYDFANRVATQRAAAGGRLKSGMLRTDYGNLDLARARDLDVQKRKLFQDALEGTVGDAFNKANTLRSAEGDIADREAAKRGEVRNDQLDRFSRVGQAINVGSGLRDQRVGEGRANRAELRGERDYQNSMERQAFDRRRQSVFDRDALENSRFGRDYSRAQFGYSGNPGSAEIGVAGGRREDASNQASAIAELFKQMGIGAGAGAGAGASGAQPQQSIVPGMSQQDLDNLIAVFKRQKAI